MGQRSGVAWVDYFGFDHGVMGVGFNPWPGAGSSGSGFRVQGLKRGTNNHKERRERKELQDEVEK
jgi:hypothetical protein